MDELEVKQGNDVSIELTFIDDDNNVADINGATVWFTIRKRIVSAKIKDDTDAVVPQKVFEDITGNTDGILTVELSAEDMSIEAGEYFADAKMLKNGKYTNSDIFKIVVTNTVGRVN